jgi:hypothetical protein
VDLVLCRDVYHCPPSVLDEQDAGTVMLHWQLHSAELEIRHRRDKKRLPPKPKS